jgi:hypothetical protein
MVRSASPVNYRRHLVSVATAIMPVPCFLAGPVGNAQAEYAGRQYEIERPRLALELSYRQESDDRVGPSIPARHNENQFLTERFDIETGGWVYHPALMTYTLRLSPEWRQAVDQPEPGPEQSSDGFMLGYGLDMTFMPYKPYTVNVFAKKQSATLTTSLATTSETLTDTYGASLRLKYKVLPTTLAYVHSESEQSGQYDARENRDEVRLNMRHERKSNDTNINASYVTRDRVILEPTASTLHTENLFGSLHNIYRITPDNRVLLNSNLTYRWAESDIYSTSGIALTEALNWRHTKRLSSNYNLTLNRDTTEATSIDRAALSAGLSHSLYENLTTTASVNADTSSSGERNVGGNLNLNYQRSIPGGMIYASIGQDYRVNSPGEGLVRVVEERFTLPPDESYFLANQNVATIVSVTRDDGSPLVAGTHYDIEVIGSATRISNRIDDPDHAPTSFKVTYDYLPPTYQSSTYGQSYGLGLYLWSAWRINYRYSHSQQDFISGIPPDVLAEDTRHTLDSDLKWRWSTTRFVYEDSDSAAGVSMTRWRVEENLLFRPTDDLFLSLSGYVGQTTFKETDSQESFHGYRCDLQWRLSNRSKINVEGFYSAFDGATHKAENKGVGARWEWSYGIWRADASYRFLNEEDLITGQIRDRQSLFFSIRRTLY